MINVHFQALKFYMLRSKIGCIKLQQLHRVRQNVDFSHFVC